MTHCKTLHSIICRVKGTPCHLQSSSARGLQDNSQTTAKRAGCRWSFLSVPQLPPLWALRAGRREELSSGNVKSSRKPQGKCKGLGYGSLPLRSFVVQQWWRETATYGQVPGSPQAGLSQRDSTGKRRLPHGAASRPTLCSQTKTLNLFQTDYFPDLNVFPLQEYDLES